MSAAPSRRALHAIGRFERRGDALLARLRPAPAPPPAPGVPPRALRPLLEVITEQSLDEDYAQAARRRARRGEVSGPVRPSPHLAAGVAVLVFALLATTAVEQTRRNAPVADQSRATLLAQIDTQKQAVRRNQQRTARTIARNNASLRTLAGLGTDLQTATARQQRLEASTGFAAVRGAGIRFTVVSAADADENQAVRDTDLALVVGGLWAAGAEAVAINGQRITTLGGLHLSGVALYVGDQGIAPPYVVSAVGDPRTLEARFYDSAAGLDFAAVARQEGFSVDVENDDDLTLPAAPARERVLRYATATATGSGSGSGTTAGGSAQGQNRAGASSGAQGEGDGS